MSRWLLGLLILSSLLMGLDRQLLGVLMEPIKHDLHLSDTALGALAGSTFALLYVVASFPLARLADNGNRKVILAACLGFWSLMTAVCGLAQTGMQLAFARMGVAIGEAGNLPASMSLVSDGKGHGKRAGPASLILAGQAFGVAFGMVLGGWLGLAIGWRATFIVLGLPGVLIALLLLFTTREPARQDVVSEAESKITFFKAFKTLAKVPAYWLMIVTIILAASASFGKTIWSTSFFVRVHHLDLHEAGISLGLGLAVISVVGTLTAGRIADWLSHRDIRWYAWFPVIILVLCAALTPIFANVSSTAAALALFCVIHFLSAQIFPCMWAIGLTVARPRTQGVTAATITACVNGGGLGLGPVIVGALNDHFNLTAGDQAIRQSMTMLAIFFIVAAGAAFLIALRLRQDRAPV